jgi:hypothetical protein
LIQHKLELYAVGLEHNPAAGIDLAGSRDALRRYLTGLIRLSPIEERMVKDLQIPDVDEAKVAGDVYAIVNDRVRLFTPGSVSRGIPYKDWAIPLPAASLENSGFYPGADIIAFVELPVPTWV